MVVMVMVVAAGAMVVVTAAAAAAVVVVAELEVQARCYSRARQYAPRAPRTRHRVSVPWWPLASPTYELLAEAMMLPSIQALGALRAEVGELAVAAPRRLGIGLHAGGASVAFLGARRVAPPAAVVVAVMKRQHEVGRPQRAGMLAGRVEQLPEPRV